MNAPLLALCEKSPALSPQDLIAVLSDGCWHHREDLARILAVSVRQIRLAANSARGQVLSGPLGIKLTRLSSEDEVNECLARFSSQISDMTERIVMTRDVWEQR